MTSEASWHHVKSQENPVDCASRGIAASKLKVHKLWWSGPQWLNQDSLHFPSIDLSTSCEEDVKCEEKSHPPFLLMSQHQVKAAIYWKSSRVTGVLTSKEVDDATKIVIQTVQESQFHSEIQLLKKKHPLPNSSKLLPLGIFLDTDGIIKVGGRLKNSSLSPIQKHTILLPKSHHLTNLVIQHFHHINLHSGPQFTLCCIRQKFWIPSGRGVVGRLLSKCQTCFRFKAKSGEQLMGNLPANRLSAGRTFLNVGIDFGGPFITKPNVSRSKVKLKSYLALFICMATKAVHLEVVSDLSADAFLAAFRRFISRRGKPTNMFSDNATNFKGASSYLKEQLKLIKSVEVQNFVTQESITWHFIPPTAAHIGGLWEAGIKSTKQLLIKTMKSAVLNFEELVTLVTQIEACLNSRPRTPLSNDTQDLQPLTPGHFLIGAPMASFPEEVPSQPACLKKRWNLIQHLRSQFWKRWHLEYLNQLQQRTKWNKPRRNMKVNDMVLVKEDNLPPLQWSLGRVVQVFPGDDGAVGVVDVKTQRGQFRRPITKCCLLPTELIVQAGEYVYNYRQQRAPRQRL
ncbi:uncharacterized protein TNCV_3830141 [Trichonephila clavipes]|nr:uncharacterized protein TNCV_3830141 [Trichonephila clavipes]